MTTEIDPSTGKYPFVDFEKTYRAQMKDRLADALGEFINDENISAEEAYKSILSELDLWLEYYEKFYFKVKKLKLMVSGFEIDDFDRHSSSAG